MIYEIFSKLETRLKNSEDFANYKFFRFDSMQNSNQQSAGSVPFLRLFFTREQSQRDAKRWRLFNQVIYNLEIRYATDYGDINDEKRIEERYKKFLAAKKAIFPQEGEENFLELQYISNLTINCTPLEIAGLEIKKHDGIMIEIIIDYYETI